MKTGLLKDIPLQSSAKHSLMLGISVLIIYSAIAALFDPFTWPIRIATTIPIVVFFMLAIKANWHTLDASFTSKILINKNTIVIWLILIGIATVFQLYNYIGEPRTIYPTISSLFEHVFQFHPLRALTFSAWLALGWWLLRR